MKLHNWRILIIQYNKHKNYLNKISSESGRIWSLKWEKIVPYRTYVYETYLATAPNGTYKHVHIHIIFNTVYKT